MTHLKSQLGTQDCEICSGTGIANMPLGWEAVKEVPDPCENCEGTGKTPIGGTTERKR